VTPTEQYLSDRIKSLENELASALADKQKSFEYAFVKGKARFEEAVLKHHREHKHGLSSYLLQGRFLAYLTAPIIYSGMIPFMLLDLFLTVYQGICFPVYGVPKARREDYFVYDRANLKYLNLLERLNCLYCSYGNGLFAYATEISARTEQHWCPIKHAQRLRAPHSRYGHFFDYGDAQKYSQQVETVRNDFVDVKTLTTSRTKPPSQ
jgi:hypothetical protein